VRADAGAIVNSRFADPGFSGDRAWLALQRQLARSPEEVSDSLLAEGSVAATTIKVPAAVALAAVMAAILIWLPDVRQNADKAKQSPDLPPPVSEIVESVEAQSATIAPPLSSSTPETVVSATNGRPETATSIPVNPLSGPPSTSRMKLAAVTSTLNTMLDSEGVVKLANDEIAMFLRRGQDFFKSGDIISARLLFRRAAAAGNAEAAYFLGRTFDPVAGSRVSIIGIRPDIARARQWYEKAAQLGSPVASQELARLRIEGCSSIATWRYSERFGGDAIYLWSR
jgi:hypothetical protein